LKATQVTAYHKNEIIENEDHDSQSSNDSSENERYNEFGSMMYLTPRQKNSKVLKSLESSHKIRKRNGRIGNFKFYEFLSIKRGVKLHL
jgi:hypothetical protein